MAQLNPRLTRRTVVLIKVESTPGTDSSPSATTDALLVSAPDFSVDATQLERDFVRNDLSPIGYRTGRKIAHCKFELEMRGNNSENSGLIGNAPLWGRCLRACGMSETAIAAGAAQAGAVRDMLNQPGAPTATWATSVSGITSPMPFYGDYLITCILGGASTVAKLRVDEMNGYEKATSTGIGAMLANENIFITASGGSTVVVAGTPTVPTITIGGTPAAGDLFNYNVHGYVGSHVLTSGEAVSTSTAATAIAAAILALQSTIFAGTAAVGAVITVAYANEAAGHAITSGSTALTLGATGVTVTPTWSGSLVLGQQWKVSVSPTGIQYQPISTGFEFFTLYTYMDGYLHKMTACQGTFSFASNSGQFGKFTFEMSGQYIGPVDALLPTPVLGILPVPPIFALAKLRLDSEDVTIAAFTYTHANTVAPREDANSTDGYFGVRITARKPVGGIDPEATYVGDYDFWSRMANSTYMQMSCLWGATPGTLAGVAGNLIWFKAPNVQSMRTTYKDRDGIRVYDMGLGFARESGDDEVKIFFG